MKWLILIFGIASNAAASILIKQAGNNLNLNALLKEPLKIFENYSLMIGIVLYFIAFILYILTLKFLPLSVAHPILTSGAIAIVAMFAFLVFKEPITLSRVFGILLIFFGVFLVAKG